MELFLFLVNLISACLIFGLLLGVVTGVSGEECRTLWNGGRRKWVLYGALFCDFATGVVLLSNKEWRESSFLISVVLFVVAWALEMLLKTPAAKKEGKLLPGVRSLQTAFYAVRIVILVVVALV